MTSRRRFRQRAKAANADLCELEIDARGRQGETLTIDIARIGSASPDRVVLHTAGLHGVEGFLGAAIQLDLMGRSFPLPEDGEWIDVAKWRKSYGQSSSRTAGVAAPSTASRERVEKILVDQEMIEKTGRRVRLRSRDYVAEGLASDHPDEVRAAAWIVARLAKTYVWPIDHIDEAPADLDREMLSVDYRHRFADYAAVFDTAGKLVFKGRPIGDSERDYEKAIKSALKDAKVASKSGGSSIFDKPKELVASRTWTNTDGNALTASLVSVSGDNGTFRKPNGQTFTYAISKLSEADQEIIKNASTKE